MKTGDNHVIIFFFANRFYVYFPFLDGDVPRLASYGVYITRLVRFARVSSHVYDFNARGRVLTAKLLRRGLRKAFWGFCRRHFIWCLDIVSD